MKQSTAYLYSLYGFIVSSQIACPQLYRHEGECEPDVTVEIGTVPEIASPLKGTGFKFEASEHEVLIKTDTIVRMLVSHGRHILVEPLAGSTEDDVRMILLGWGMGALLHQRGILPLHAAALAGADGSCIALCADSGTGKSTVGAALLRLGRRLLDDNISALAPSGNELLVMPGCPEVRLTDHALGFWHRDWITGLPSWPCRHKTGLFMETRFESVPRPLKAVFMISCGSSNVLRFRRIGGIEALRLLRKQIFCYRFLAGMGQPARHFETLLTVANKVPVFSLELSHPKPHPDRVAEMIENLLDKEMYDRQSNDCE